MNGEHCNCWTTEEASWTCNDGVHRCADGCGRILMNAYVAENCAVCLDRKEHKGHGSPCEDDPLEGTCALPKLKESGTSKRPQVGGAHYEMAIEPIDFIMANDLNFCEGCVIKYIVRYRKKNGVEDLRKARQYIDFLIDGYEE